MKMPIRVRPQPNQPVWQVNDRVEVIDEAFDKFVGRVGGNVKGSQMLDEETKVRSRWSSNISNAGMESDLNLCSGRQ